MRFIGSVQGETFHICGEELLHASKVMRLTVGDSFTGIDFSGKEYFCTILSITKGECVARIEKTDPGHRDPEIHITLFQAIPKACKMETILQKCTELGISTFIPFVSQRCVKKPKDNLREKLQKVSDEAIKQCKRCDRVDVQDTHTFDEMIRRLSEYDQIIFCYEEENTSTLKQVLKNFHRKKKFAVLIGTEGGFSPEEASAIAAAGGACVTLGKRILRTETAGSAAVAMLLYEYTL